MEAAGQGHEPGEIPTNGFVEPTSRGDALAEQDRSHRTVDDPNAAPRLVADDRRSIRGVPGEYVADTAQQRRCMRRGRGIRQCTPPGDTTAPVPPIAIRH